MSQGEIINLLSPAKTSKDYFNLIINKTAYFTQTACQLGALCAGAPKKEEGLLKEFGLNFGIAYQLMDDYKDGEVPRGIKLDCLREVEKYTVKCRKNLDSIKNSIYKDALLKGVDFVIQNHFKN